MLGNFNTDWIRSGGLLAFVAAILFATALIAEDRIWHIALPKDPRAAQIKAAHRIGVMASSPLAWVPALVELQWLALATALNRGVNPDGDR